MKVIIAGGRDYNNYAFLAQIMDDFAKENNVEEVVCSCAAGADSLGAKWAKERGIPVKEFPAEWDVFGKKAGILRNHDMGNYADFLVAFWDGQSTGTRDMISYMKQIGKHGTVIKYEISSNEN